MSVTHEDFSGTAGDQNPSGDDAMRILWGQLDGPDKPDDPSSSTTTAVAVNSPASTNPYAELDQKARRGRIPSKLRPETAAEAPAGQPALEATTPQPAVPAVPLFDPNTNPHADIAAFLAHRPSAAQVLAEQQMNRRRLLIGLGVIGGASLLAAAGGVGVYEAVKRAGDKAIDTHGGPLGSGQNGEPFGSGETGPSVQPTFPNIPTAHRPDVAGFLNLGQQNVANLNVSHYSLDWNGTALNVPFALYVPGNAPGRAYSAFNLANDVMSYLMAFMTLNPDSQNYQSVLNSFTDSSDVKAYIERQRQAFAKLFPDATIPYQTLFYPFDTFSQGASFAQTDDSSVGLADGTLYARGYRWSPDWQVRVDDQARIPADAFTLPGFSFAWGTTGPDAQIKISRISYPMVDPRTGLQIS